MLTLGPGEMVAIFLLALLMFGPKELPKLGKTLGKAMSEFRRAQSELKSTFDREMKNLERETGIQELRATNFQSDSYNYDSSYDSSYYDGSYGSGGNPGENSATAPLQVEAAAGSIPSGHLEAAPVENAWAPYTPETPEPAGEPPKAPQEEAPQKAVHG